MVDFVRSQGTEIFILPDPLDTTPMKMACPTAVSKSGGARTMSEILCLDADDPEFISGSRSSTTWSIPFALVPLVWFTSHAQVMGDHRNARPIAIIAWVVVALIVALNAALVALLSAGIG